MEVKWLIVKMSHHVLTYTCPAFRSPRCEEEPLHLLKHRWYESRHDVHNYPQHRITGWGRESWKRVKYLNLGFKDMSLGNRGDRLAWDCECIDCVLESYWTEYLHNSWTYQWEECESCHYPSAIWSSSPDHRIRKFEHFGDTRDLSLRIFIHFLFLFKGKETLFQVAFLFHDIYYTIQYVTLRRNFFSFL